MSIQIGSNSYTTHVQPGAGSTVAAENDGSTTRLGQADTRYVGQTNLARAAVGNSSLALEETTMKEGEVPDELDAKLEKMAQITDIYAVMALFQKLSQQARDTAREERMAAMEARVAALGQAADKMREAAKWRLWGTVAQASMQIVSAAGKIGASATSIKGSVKAGDLSTKAQKLSQQAAQRHEIADQAAGVKTNKFDSSTHVAKMRREANALDDQARSLNTQASALNAKISARQGVIGGTSEIVASTGSIIKGGFDYMAARRDAEKMELETKAELERAAYDRANETMQQMRDIIRDIQSKLAEMERSTHETNRQITRA